MTHAELVEVARRWLTNRVQCSPVFCELVTIVGETPDAIGWRGWVSFLVECKASRADFLRDKHKPWRDGRQALGDLRYFLCPPNVIREDDLPDGWGLLWADGKRVAIKKFSGTAEGLTRMASLQRTEVRGYTFELGGLPFDADKRSEIQMLRSVIRRVELRGFDLRSIQGAMPEALA